MKESVAKYSGLSPTTHSTDLRTQAFSKEGICVGQFPLSFCLLFCTQRSLEPQNKMERGLGGGGYHRERISRNVYPFASKVPLNFQKNMVEYKPP